MKKICLWKLLCCCLLMLAIAIPSTAQASGLGTQAKEAFAMKNMSATATLVSPPIAGKLSPEALSELTVYAGGMPFGVKFFTDGVTVVGFCDVEAKDGKKINPATAAGLRPKDVILKVNGETLTGASALTEQIENCGGKPLQLHCRRGKNEFDITLTPVWCPAETRYKTGIWVRDSGAGIGTVTFILPDSGKFAGLGHGICDADTGELIAMKRGSISDVTISSVVRGAAGAPGELKGYFHAGKVGALLGNSLCGVWGVFSELPDSLGEEMKLGLRDELAEGDAYILTTLDNNQTERYAIRISNINREANGSKCFTVTVTDQKLLSRSGGIVQGMSGSPIIQNGKLVGAVTHVLINDPTTGYGIFIENMLNAVQMPMAKAS